VDADDYAELADYWKISLRNQNLSPETIRSYMRGVTQYRAWCAQEGVEPTLSLRSAEAFTASILAAGKSAATATLRQIAIRLFSAWLAAQHPPEIERDELAGMKPPKLDSRVVEHLTDAQLTAMLAMCSGRRLVDLRDDALIRFMVSTTARADEVISLKTWDVQIAAGSAVIIRGKGGKGRRVGFGPRTGESLARYARARKRHALAAAPELWLAHYGRVLNYQALYKTLDRRAKLAGIAPFHPHMLRHTAAIRWLRAGGSVTGLMAQGGWTDIAMVQRYIQTASEELAIAESHRLDGGI
jgi:integrase/recombinase XerD